MRRHLPLAFTDGGGSANVQLEEKSAVMRVLYLAISGCGRQGLEWVGYVGSLPGHQWV